MRGLFVGLMVGFLSIPQTGFAQTYTWNLVGAGSWDTTTAANWDIGTYVNSPTATARFGNRITGSSTITVSTGITAGSILFDSVGSFGYTLSSGSLILGDAANNGFITLNRGITATQTIGATTPISFGQNLNIVNNGAFGTAVQTLNLGATITRLTSGGSISVGGTGNTTLAGVINNSITGGLTKTDSGVLTLSAANAFTGNVTVTEGVLSVSANNQLGDGLNTINIANAVFANTTTTFNSGRVFNFSGNSFLSNSFSFNSSGTIAGSGTFNKVGSSNLSLTTNSTFSGDIVIGGPVRLVGTSLYTPVDTNAIRLTDTGGRLTSASSVTVTNNATLEINQSTNTLIGRVNGLTSNSGRLNYITGGTTTIADTIPNLTMSGLTVLSTSTPGGPGPSGGTAVTFTTLNRNNNATLLLRGRISSNGQIGGVAPASEFTNFFVNGMVDSGGSGTAQNVVPWASFSNLSSSANDPIRMITYDSAVGFRFVQDIELQTVSSALVAGVNNTPSGTIAVPTNVSVLTLNTPASSYTLTGAATVTVTNGAIVNSLSATFNGPTIAFGSNPGYFHLGANVALTGTSNITGSAGVVVSSLNSSYRFSTTAANSFTGGLHIFGVQTAASTFTAGANFTADNQLGATNEPIVLSAGQLNLTSGTVTLSDRPITLLPAGGALSAVSTSTLTVPGVISGSGQLNIVGAGIVVLSNPSFNPYSGGTAISGGTLQISSAGQLGTGDVLLNSGTLAVTASTNLLQRTVVTASSTINVSTGTVDLPGGLDGLGSTTLTKTGTGTLAPLGGTFAGTLVVNSGTVNLAGTAGRLPNLTALTVNAGTTLSLNSSTGNTALSDRLVQAAVTLNTGNLTITGNASAATSESVRSLIVGSGSNVVTLAPGSGQALTATFRLYNRTAGNVLFRGDQLGDAASTNRLFLLNQSAGLLTGALWDGSNTGSGSDLAGYDATRGVRQAQTSDFYGVAQSSGRLIQNSAPTSTPATANVRIDNGGPWTTSAALNTINLLYFESGSTLTVSSTLTVASGQLYQQPGPAATLTGGTVAFSSANALLFGNGSSNVASALTSTAGGLTKSGTGTTTLTGTFGIVGPIDISAGTLNYNPSTAATFSNGTANGLNVGTGATLNLNNNNLSVGALSGAGTILAGTGNLTFNQGATTTFTGTITGGSQFTKTGSSSLTLNPATALNYTGSTTISNGTLILGAANVLPATTTLSFANSSTAQLNLNGFNQTVAGIVITPPSSSGIPLNLGASGTLTLNGNISYTPTGGNFPSTFTGIGTSTINLGGSVRDITIAANANSGGDIVINVPLTNGGINYTGTPTSGGTVAVLTFGAANTYAGSTTVNRGTLLLNIANALPATTAVTLNSTTTGAGFAALLNLNGFSQTVAGLASPSGVGTNTVTSTAATLTVNGSSDTTFNGTLAGTVALAKQGSSTLTLAGTNTTSGALTVTGTGAVRVNGSTGAGSAVSTTAAGGTIGGTGTINGTLTLNTGGTVAPGAGVGALTVGNSTIMNVGSAYQWELNNATPAPGTNQDQLVTATLNLAALTSANPMTIRPVTLNGGTPGLLPTFNTGAFQEWTLIDYTTLTGTFASNLFTFDTAGFANALDGGTFAVANDVAGTRLTVQFTPVPEPSTWLGLMALSLFGRRCWRRTA